MPNEQIELLEPPEKVNHFEMTVRKTNVKESWDPEEELISMCVKPTMNFNFTHHAIDDSSLNARQMTDKFYRAMSHAFQAFDEVMQKEMGIANEQTSAE